MKSLREAVALAREGKYAIGHFNIGNMEILRAVVAAGQETGLPVIIGVSEGERDAFGVKEVVALTEAIRKDTGREIYLNADHTYSVERVREAIDSGFDAVIFDGAKLSLEENILKTKECVEYARISGRDILVEGELGFIGSGSQMLDSIPEGAITSDEMMTSIEDAERFVSETGVDLFAPAVGNIHGMLREGGNPRLNSDRISDIVRAVPAPLVLHGGSGIADRDFTSAIEAGISIIHISTELRLAYRESLQKSLQDNPKELAPYKYTKEAIGMVKEVVKRRSLLFAPTR